MMLSSSRNSPVLGVHELTQALSKAHEPPSLRQAEVARHAEPPIALLGGALLGQRVYGCGGF